MTPEGEIEKLKKDIDMLQTEVISLRETNWKQSDILQDFYYDLEEICNRYKEEIDYWS